MNMKKIACLLFSLLLFVACDKNEDIIYDYAPVAFTVKVVDGNGNTRLNSEKFLSSLSFDYNGENYTIENMGGNVSTRAYLARFSAPYVLSAQLSDGTTRTSIYIGEWAGDAKWNNETVTINWPDGTHSNLSFTLKKTGITNATYYLDGEKHSGAHYKFVKP